MAIYGFHSEISFRKKLCIENWNFEPFFELIEKRFTEKRTYANKGWIILTPYLLTVFMSIPSNKLPCTRLSLESNKPRENWYGLTEVDQNEIYFPTLQISGAKTIQRTRKYGPKDSDYFWFKSPHNFEYQQALKATIYCSFDFQTYPFDAHYCDFNFVPTDNTIKALSLDPPELRFKKLESK